MNKHNSVVRLLVFGFIVGGTVGVLGPQARAKYERYQGSACRPTIGTGPSDFTYSYRNTVGTTTAWLENNETTAQNFICPMPDETGLGLTNITHISLSVHDGSTVDYIWAKACAMYQGATSMGESLPNTSGHTCGFRTTGANETSTAGTGPSGITLPLGEATRPALQTGETGYIWVGLPGKQGGITSKVNSFYVFGT